MVVTGLIGFFFFFFFIWIFGSVGILVGSGLWWRAEYCGGVVAIGLFGC